MQGSFNHCSRSIEYPQQRGASNTDSWHTALKGFLRSQQLLAHTTPGILHVISQVISRDSWNERGVVPRIAQQPGNVRHDDKGIGLQGDSNCSGGTVTIDVQALSLPAQCQRRDNRGIASIEELPQQCIIHLLDLSGVVVAQYLLAPFWS